jgi:rRNA maturation RNase YbeY
MFVKVRSLLRRKALLLHTDGVATVARALLARFDLGEHDLSVTLCGDGLMSKLSGKGKPTDVLSFRSEMPPEVRDAGELYIDVPYVLRVCAKSAAEGSDGTSACVEAKVVDLLAHGVAHLAGHDHMNDADERKMLDAEKRALLGLAGTRATICTTCTPGTCLKSKEAAHHRARNPDLLILPDWIHL